MEYAFYGDKDLVKAVEYIKKGDSDADYAMDLATIAGFAEKYSQKLIDSGCDMKHVEVIKEYQYKYGELIAKCTVEEGEKNLLGTARDKAFTFLVVAIEEVRRAARHAFWNDKKRLRGYASEYFRKSTRKQNGN